MVFSGLTFLYCFLPMTLGAYFLVPPKRRNGVLLAASLFFYGWGEPRYLLLMLGAIGVFYAGGLWIEKSRRKRLALAVCVGLGLTALGIFKYAGFFTRNLQSVTGFPQKAVEFALPMGISFYLFQCISYAADVYRGTPAQKSPLKFALYVSMFPQLVAGPIVRYDCIAEQLSRRETSLPKAAEGLTRFLIGLGKKVLLADALAVIVAAYRDSGEKTVLFAWLYAVAFMLEIYYDFSGYSDMAIGLGKMLGFSFPENFDYPYCANSVTAFWRRWHMSLGQWFRDYVYIPLGGNRQNAVRNVLIVWLLTGFWHGAGWNFILWGGFYGCLLLLERRFSWLRGHVYLLMTVLLGFVLFNGESLGQIAGDLGAMAGLGRLPLWGTESVYVLSSSLRLLSIGLLGATPLPKRFAQRLPGSVWRWLFSAALLLLCTAKLVDSSFQPFLYFRF